MLRLYKARHLEPLAEQYYKVNSGIVRPLLETYPVIVPNMAVGRWLVQYLAKKQRICANMERLMPGAFLWRLIVQMDSSLPEFSDFNEEVMIFRTLGLLDDPSFINEFPRLSNYLNECGQGDKVELAKKISKIFDQYQIYRNDWLEQWEDGITLDLGDDEGWQQALWQQLVLESDQAYRASLEDKLVKSIEDQAELINFPDSLCLFGITSLTPGFIKVIKALSTKIDIHLFAFSSDESIGEPKITQAVLSHWKETGNAFFEQLNIDASFVQTVHSVENHLQHLQNVITSNPQAELISPTKEIKSDNSITSVCCYSAMREVEAVHDYLLKLLDENKDLQSGDILIALPDLDTYAPYIRAVFDGSDINLPYYINDSLASSESPLINGLTELLTLPKWRFTREQVMVLLHNRLVQKRFNVTDGDIEQIESWLDDAGIRWGINADHWQELDLPVADDSFCQNTWQAGLDRLLLGFALPKKLDAGNSLFKGVLPVDEMECSGSELLSHFVNYCEKLIDWRNKLQQSFSLYEWQMLLQQLVNDFFTMDQDEENNKLILLNVFDQLSNDAQQANYENNVDIEAVSALLTDAIASNSRGVRLSGSINIASFSSLASLPFKYVCLLGMNFDSWPSKQRQPGFDLLAKKFRAGDRNRSNDERYLTLQLILSAKEGLYLSYTGRNIHNGEEIPPSVLLSELINISEKIKPLQHPMHVYSPNNFLNNALFKSHNSMWLQTAKLIGKGRESLPPLSHTKQLPEPEDEKIINLDDVIRFFINPQAYFLRHRLGIFLADEGKSWENVEPFNLSNFADSKVRHVALKQSLNGDAGSAAMVSKAMGVLPHGQHGDLLQQMEQEKVDTLLEGLSDDYSDPVLDPVSADISIARIQLSGTLRDLRAQGQLFIQPDDLYPYQKIQFWLQHLFLCCIAPDDIKCITRVQSLGGEMVFSAPDNPQKLLTEWIEAYQQGQLSPLSFYAKVSWDYAYSFKKNADDDKALSAAKKKWDDTYLFSGENAKPANQYLYRGHDPLDEGFKDLAQKLLLPLLTNEENI